MKFLRPNYSDQGAVPKNPSLVSLPKASIFLYIVILRATMEELIPIVSPHGI